MFKEYEIFVQLISKKSKIVVILFSMSTNYYIQC